jgi:hypothetical protein
MFAEHGEAFSDIGDVGVGMRLVGVAEHGGGLAAEGGREDAVAEVGLGAAAGAEVVRRPPDGDLDASDPMGGEQVLGHPAAEFALPGVRPLWVRLGERCGGTSVHVDVLHAYQPSAGGLGGGEHPGLQSRKLGQLRGVRRVEGLVDDRRALGHRGGEGGVAGVPAHHRDVVGYGACPDRLTSRTVWPRRRSASKVARPIAPVPRVTCRAVVMS